MREIEIRGFKPEDMMCIFHIPHEERVREHPNYPEWAEARGKYGPAYSFFHGNLLVCCAGVTIYWPGMGEVWSTFSEHAAEFKKEIVILAGGVLDDLQEANKLRRVHADIAISNEYGRRFVEHYGFYPEGIMRMYGPNGEDCIRYARLRRQYRVTGR